MAFTVAEITNLNTHVLETYLNKGQIFKQNVANKPMLEAFNEMAGKFVGGNTFVSYAVKGVVHAGSLVGFTHDDQVGYYNPVAGVRAKATWREHHIGHMITGTELKMAGVDLIEDGDTASQSTRDMSGREKQLLVDIIEEKRDEVGEDYAFSLDNLIHGDGTSDAKAIAGIGSILLANPAAGSTFGLSRTTYPWWRNRAATAAALAASSGPGAVVSNTANGGTLIEFMDTEARFRNQFRNAQSDIKYFCGSDFIDAYRKELRANGRYTETGWGGRRPDGSMQDPNHAGLPLVWDPTMNALGMAKRCYAIDMGKTGVRLLYMDGQRMKKHNPARPHDRYVMYNGITMTGVMIAKQLNTSGVYDIA